MKIGAHSGAGVFIRKRSLVLAYPNVFVVFSCQYNKSKVKGKSPLPLIQNFNAGMCGPVSQCCCCFPALVGVKFIAGLLSLLELAGLTYNTIILVENNEVRQQMQ